MGGNVRRGADIRLTVAARDAGHLAHLQAHVGSSGPIDAITRGTRRYVGVRFWSPAMAADLARHGVVERKTPLVAWPATVPPQLLRHYLRGYHDGDGWLCVRRWQYNSLEWGLVANLDFLRDCAAYLERTLGLKPPAVRRRNPDKPYGSMSYHGRLQVSRLWRFLNDGATIWLARKRDKVEPYVR